MAVIPLPKGDPRFENPLAKALRRPDKPPESFMGKLGQGLLDTRILSSPLTVRDVGQAVLPGGNIAEQSMDLVAPLGNVAKRVGKKAANLITDSLGDPRRFFHGTSKSYDHFAKGKERAQSFLGGGFHFSPNPATASEYAMQHGGDMANVRPVFLYSDRVFDAFGSFGQKEAKEFSKALVKRHYDPVDWNMEVPVDWEVRSAKELEEMLTLRLSGTNKLDALHGLHVSREGPLGLEEYIQLLLRDLGFDSAKYPLDSTPHQMLEKTEEAWVVFDPSQIISALSGPLP